MSQPSVISQTDSIHIPTQTEIALEEWRQAGVPIEKGHRLYRSKKMTGFNQEVYSSWIERWARNSAVNYPIINRADGVSFLRNSAKDIPCIVVGIGPSFDENIEALRMAQRHAIIIATDAALRPMIRHGIKPDLIVNYDARDHQKTMWETIDTKPYVLLANSVTSPKTINAWEGQAMFFNMMQGDDEFAENILPCIYPDLGQLPNLGTVGNGIVFLAWQMGCKPIMTVGMDLCYKEKEIPKPHTEPLLNLKEKSWRYRCKDWKFISPTVDLPDGAWEEIENRELYDNDERMKHTFDEEIKGKTYRVDEPLKFYRNSLFQAIGRFDMDIINCSGGVFSDQIKSMPLKEVLIQKCSATLERGATVVKFLPSLISDCKQGWIYNYNENIWKPY